MQRILGIVGSTYSGVAPFVNLINLKVLCKEGSSGGTDDDIARAIEDIIDEHDANKKKKDRDFRGSVINMSLGEKKRFYYFDRAVSDATRAGIAVVVAAGNYDAPASDYTPCNSPGAICVGAVDAYYNKVEKTNSQRGSNWGTGVHINAPGDSISSTSVRGWPFLKTYTGTSQAAPHVAGAIAIFMSWEAISVSPSLLRKRLWDNGLANVLGGLDAETPNLLVTTGIHHPKKGRRQPYFGAPRYPTPPGQSKVVVEAESVQEDFVPEESVFPDASDTTAAGLPRSAEDGVTWILGTYSSRLSFNLLPSAWAEHDDYSMYGYANSADVDTRTLSATTLPGNIATDPTMNPGTATTTSTTFTGSPTPTHKLEIAYTYSWDVEAATSAVFWNFYDLPYTATAFDPCLPRDYSTIATSLPSPTVTSLVPMPSGTFPLGHLGDYDEDLDCTYVGDGTSAGTLTCPDSTATDFVCQDISGDDIGETTTDPNCSGGYDKFNTFAWKVVCLW